MVLTAMNSFATLVAVPRVDSDWGSGLTGAVVLKNTGSDPVSNWTATISMPGAISSIWNAAVVAKNGNTVEVGHVGWNSTIPAGGQVEFGFLANPGGFAANQILVTPGAQATSPAPTPAPTPIPPSQSAPTPALPTGSPNSDFTQNGLRMEFRVVSDWGSGLTASVKLVNTTSAPIGNWVVAMNLATTPSGPWDATHSRSGTRSEFRPVSWNSSIPAGGSVSFGFNASPGNLTQPPTNVVISASQSSTPASQPTPTPTPAPTPVASPTPAPTPAPLPDEASNPPALKNTKIVGYFVEWGIYGRNYNVSDIPADKLNVINYAFANISPQGEVVIYDSWAAIEKAFPGDSWEKMPRGNFNQLAKLKQKHPHLITMISVGGWTLSSRFSDVALTPQSRARFAKSAVDFLIQHGFDGVDIDWEYPVGGGLESNVYRPEDKQNYTLLLRELRRQLDARGALDGRKYYLTIAAPAGDDKIRNIEPAGIAAACDWINIMTYDFAGGWDKHTGHQAPMFSPEGRSAANPSTLWSVDGAVRQFLAAGVDPKKLVVGVPFYGRGWSGVSLANSGIGQLSTGLPQGSYEPGVFDYKDLVAKIQSNPVLYEVFEDSQAEASFLFAPGDNGLWVSFDDTAIVQRKVDYIKQLGLGGAMFWELSGDTKNPSTSLLEVLHKGLAK
ncbi:MAG: glycosyl hydrolase family 18 protein [Verrucomicrobiota bacterium]